jgi:flagellar biosynthesis/type III secretory pathway protein FliH
LEGFGAKTKEGWEKGVYFLPKYQKAAIVAINQLSMTEDTLWLRVMGKGKTQTEAITQVVKLSENNHKWERLVEIFASWRKNLELNSNVSDEERELIMSLSPAYLKQREEWKQEGIEEGRQQGRQQGQKDGQRLMVESLLAVRFGNLDEELSAIVSPLMELSLTERTQLLLNLSNLSREELLARFKVD